MSPGQTPQASQTLTIFKLGRSEGQERPFLARKLAVSPVRSDVRFWDGFWFDQRETRRIAAVQKAAQLEVRADAQSGACACPCLQRYPKTEANVPLCPKATAIRAEAPPKKFEKLPGTPANQFQTLSCQTPQKSCC